jgi:plasmid maintenance system antidote protein VapI
MSGHRPFSELRKDWCPERLAANGARKAKLAREMISLEQLRKELGISQEELANVIQGQRPAISKLVRRPDIQISTSRA